MDQSISAGESGGGSDLYVIREGSLESPGSHWLPKVGPEFRAFSDRQNLNEDTKIQIEADAKLILGKCVKPDDRDSSTSGLVVGQIQSGKTLSMTALAALAKDNKFPLVIVLTGTSINLNNQNVKRMTRDLDVLGVGGQGWRHFKEPKRADTRAIQGLLATWRSTHTTYFQPRSALITLLKHVAHLNSLTEVLRELDLSETPALVIDDECDSASLNSNASKRATKPDATPTYHHISELRNSLPVHTYVGYTATPQANILISIADNLSPEFAHVIKPGDDYTGPAEFFGRGSSVVESVDPNEVPSDQNQIETTPPSLRRALGIFVVGCTVKVLRGQYGPFSMMVHPHQHKAWHRDYRRWIDDVLGAWSGTLSDYGPMSERPDLVAEFRSYYEELQQTDDQLQPFEEIDNALYEVVNSISQGVDTIHENVNRTLLRDIDEFWAKTPLHILIGGQLLSRGFTVEGLLVTYMPRPSAIDPVVDVVQQRGRFFGYRRADFSLTRVFLQNNHTEMYRLVIEHQAHMLRAIEEFEATGESFTGFKRRLILDTRYRPTRSSIISDPTSRGLIRKRWNHPLPPYGSSYDKDRLANKNLWTSFIERHHFEPWTSQTHRFVGLRLGTVIDELLVPWRVPAHHWRDPRLWDEMLFHVSHWRDEHPDELCYVFQMRPEATGTFRSLRRDSYPLNPTYNPHSDGSLGESADRNIRVPGEICVQVSHFAEIYSDSSQTEVLGRDLYGVSFDLAEIRRPLFETFT